MAGTSQADDDSSVRLDAVSDWWLTHRDRHAAVFLDPRTGPFRSCDSTLGHLRETYGCATPAIGAR
ncbi:DUF4913 domain-containing protein [Curtobacterium sp. RRHDQ10]|uniref:DUF4913 domain-containing protein n=1 Tax=Curtobacterium phyllosphaerae TaxID=3413379 RepID=UPI003BF282C9